MSGSFDWAKRKIFGGSNADPHSWEELLAFPFIWGLFERKLCDKDANLSTVRNLRGSVEPFLRSLELENEWLYFRNRYTTEGIVNETFNRLWEREGGKCFVKCVLEGSSPSNNEKAEALLIIVWRFRNQFYHGVKEFYYPKEQNENYEKVNKILRLLIDHS
ncbi:MAG: hypothetical protein WAM60_09390 [Candidatus Promineifilaceae bacterium]